MELFQSPHLSQSWKPCCKKRIFTRGRPVTGRPFYINNMKVSVFAASSSKIGSVYIEAATVLGKLLSDGEHETIYGGGDTGLMGALADSVRKSGGMITGVIPEFMVKNGWNHTGVKNMVITEDMNSRKRKIFELADAVIALPGGVGTLEELTEAITLKQLGLFHGPVIILNVSGFYDRLLGFMDHLSDTGFIRADHRNLWSVASTPEEAMEMITSYRDTGEEWVKLARI